MQRSSCQHANVIIQMSSCNCHHATVIIVDKHVATGVGPSTPLQTGVNLNEVTVLAGQAQSYSPVAPGQSGVPGVCHTACISLLHWKENKSLRRG